MSKIIKGLRINQVPMEKYIDKDSYTVEYNDDIISEYEFLYLEDGKLFSECFAIEYGECGSGYCGAEWIKQGRKKQVLSLGTLHYIPKGKLEIDYFITSDYDGNDYFILYENDCAYYPGANIQIKFENWIDTKRGKEKKQIYIFKGPSAIGKSYIANSTNLTVFETDGQPLDELNVSYDIIVIGNKHNYTTKNIISKFKDENIKDIEFILVGFKNITNKK
jgi:hypothetical protein